MLPMYPRRRQTKLSALTAVLFALVVTIAPRFAAATDDAVVRGVVEDALLHPLKGASVVLHDAAGNTVAHSITGADGTFVFPGIAFGDYTVEANLSGLIEDHQHLQVSSSAQAAVELVLVNSEEVINITENYAVPPPSTATGSVTTVSREKLAELPGGEDRPITDVVTTQPGFVADGLGNVYARGNHANIQYQIDGVPIPDSVGSLFAASIPVRIVQNLEIYSGGMPAEYGDRLGAVVNLSTRHGAAESDGNVQVRYGSFNTFEPSATYSTTIDKTGVFIGGSYLTSDRALDPPSVDPILHDNGESGRMFTRIDREINECNRVEFFATYAHNRFDVPLDPTAVQYDPNNPIRPVDQYGNPAPVFIPLNTNATETEDELYAAASWIYSMGTAGRLQISPFYKFSRGVLDSDPTHALGATADPGATASNVNRLAQHYGAVAQYSVQVGDHTIKAGVQSDYLVGNTRYAEFVRDDAAGGGIDPNLGGAGSDNITALTSGVYAQDSWQIGHLILNGGLRGDQFHVGLGGGKSDDKWGVSPRLGGSYTFTKNFVGHAFAGVNWQPPAPLDAAAAARALGVVPAGQTVAYDLKPETDLYSELGVNWRIVSQLRSALTAWGRYAYNQLDDTAIGSTSLLSNYNFERGRAAGLELSAEFRLSSWLSAFANGSYGFAQGQGISSAKYLFTADELANTSWQTLDHAQTWTANGGVTVRDKRFTATALTAYGSGLRTGADNTSHVPGHIRTDVSMNYTFTPSGYPMRVGMEIVNLFDEHYAYRIANGFVGSSYGPPISAYLTLSIPLSKEPTGTKADPTAAMPAATIE